MAYEKADRANAKPTRFNGLTATKLDIKVEEGNFVDRVGNPAAFTVVIDADIFKTTTAAAGIKTGAVIPANAMIISCVYIGTAGTVGRLYDIGKEGDVDFFVNNGSMNPGVNYITSAQAIETNWLDVGDEDVELFANVTASNASANGKVIITYVK